MIKRQMNLPVSKWQLVSLCTSCQTGKLIPHTDTKYWLVTLILQHLQKMAKEEN